MNQACSPRMDPNQLLSLNIITVILDILLSIAVYYCAVSIGDSNHCSVTVDYEHYSVFDSMYRKYTVPSTSKQNELRACCFHCIDSNTHAITRLPILFSP